MAESDSALHAVYKQSRCTCTLIKCCTLTSAKQQQLLPGHVVDGLYICGRHMSLTQLVVKAIRNDIAIQCSCIKPETHAANRGHKART